MRNNNWGLIFTIVILASIIVGTVILNTVSLTGEIGEEQYKKPDQEANNIQKKQKIELIEMKTGYYHDYYPAIIMRWKNISQNNITKSMAIKVAFFLENEELSQHNEYVHSYSNTPFERGTTRQVFIESNIKLRSRGNVIAKIYVDDLLYDVVKVENQYLISNMLQ